MNKYEFPIPNEINGDQLKAELNCDDVYVLGDKLFIVGDLSQTQASAGVANHKPKPVAQPTVAEKLASVGLSLDDLKVALGL